MFHEHLLAAKSTRLSPFASRGRAYWRIPAPSASPRCLYGGDVDLLHRHHRLEGTLCLIATNRKRIG